MDISKNASNSHRFDINQINDIGYTTHNEQVKGIRGYHGRFENIIGWVLENILHKAVSVEDQKGNKYYLNCNSLVKWADRVKKQGYEIDPKLSSFVRDSKLVQTALESIKKKNQKETAPDDQRHPEQDSSKPGQNEPSGNVQSEKPNNPPERPQESPKPLNQKLKEPSSPKPPLRSEEPVLKESSENQSPQPGQVDQEANQLIPEVSNLDPITEENIRDFDFSTVILSKDSVSQLFERVGIYKLPTISKENVELLAPYFSDTHWQWLSDQQVKDFDFSKVTLSKEIIDKVFSFEGLPTKASERLPTISKENVALISPYFSDRHWMFLSDGQIGNFDFSKLQGSDKEKQAILERLFSTVGGQTSNANQRIPLLSANNLYTLASFFSENNLWAYVDDFQIQQIDFSKVNLETDKKQRVVDILFNPIADNIREPSKADQRIPRLSEDQLYDLAPFFDSENLWSLLSDDQVQMLDFATLKDKLQPEKYQKMLSTLFDYKKKTTQADRRFKSLDNEQVQLITADLNNTLMDT